MSEKVVFYDRFNRGPTEATPVGDGLRIVCDCVLDKETGEYKLVDTGEREPIQEEINAACGINVLDLDECYRRYVNGEDVKLVIRPMTYYGDTTEFGRDLMDTYIKVRDNVIKLDEKTAAPESVPDTAAATEEKGS